MKLYVYTDVKQLTDRWHAGGGLVIVTDRDPVDAYNGDLIVRATNEIQEWEWKSLEETLQERTDFVAKLARTELPEPARVYDIPEADTERVDIFPNAGCC